MEGVLRDWPLSERPRERLLAHGAAGMSDAELVALVVGGTSRGNGGVVNSCRALLQQVGGLQRLVRCSAGELTRLPGIGRARACALVAAGELGRRACTVVDRGQPLSCSQQAFACVRGQLAGLRQEVFMVLALDARGRLLGRSQVAQGSATAVDVHPREVFGPLVREGAAAGIAVHNHPSGDPEPSADDLQLTARLVKAGEIIGIPLIDHLIVGHGCYVSFADRTLL